MEDELHLQETFLDKQLFSVSVTLPWYANIVNYLVSNMFPPGLSKAQRDKIKSDAKYFVWDDTFLWKHCADQVIRRCVPKNEIISILTFCHSYACGGHFGAKRMARKVLECGFYWPSLFRDSYSFCKSCKHCQFVKFLMFGASISWDCSLYHLVMFIFCLLLIMSRNRWKLKLPGLMILKLLQILSNLTHSLGLKFQEL